MSALENQSTLIPLLRIYLNRKCIMTSQKRLGGGGGGGGGMDATSTWHMKLSIVTMTLMKFMIDNFVSLSK